ncbi:MAG: hypothetical protein IIC21_03190, partial [Chloroflexi bacterium]|nr:hypothetical protein [Chloroflexota bacterium]
MGIVKIIVLSVLVVVVIVVVLVAVAAFSIFNSISGEPMPLSPEIIAKGQAVAGKIREAVTDKSAFYLELTDDELSSLLLFRAGSVSPIRALGVVIHPGSV